MTYPVVSSTCFPHIAQRPFLYAHPKHHDQYQIADMKKSSATYHDNTWPHSALYSVYSLYICSGTAIWKKKRKYQYRYQLRSKTSQGQSVETGVGIELETDWGRDWGCMWVLTWNLFFELPGRESSLFSPTLLEPSLIAFEDDVKGSGAASFEVFWSSLLFSSLSRAPSSL